MILLEARLAASNAFKSCYGRKKSANGSGRR